MTKDPQLTTHNAERGAHGTCRERSETGSSPKRTEKKVGFSLISEISWRFRVKCSAVWRKYVARYVGDLEETCLVIWRKLIRQFLAEKCVGDLEKSLGDFGGSRSAITLEIWRKLIRQNCGQRFSYWRLVWSIVVLGNHMWRLKHNGEKWRQVMETKTLFITK